MTTTDTAPSPRKKKVVRRKKADASEAIAQAMEEEPKPAPVVDEAQGDEEEKEPVTLQAATVAEEDGDDGDGDEDEAEGEAEADEPRGRPRVAAQSSEQSLEVASTEIRARRVQKYLDSEDDLAEIVSGLEFGESKHEVRLSRTRWRNSAGFLASTSGSAFLDKFQRPVSVSEIKDLYGGGEFLYTVWGPNPAGKIVLKGKKAILIEGPSLLNGKLLQGDGITVDSLGSMAKDLLKTTLDSKERENERILAELTMLRKAAIDRPDPTAALRAELAEERKAAAEREEKRLRDEREARERELLRLEKLEAERRAEDVRRREEEKERTAAEKKLAMDSTLQMIQMMQNNTQVLIASLKENSASKEVNGQTMLQLMQQQNTQQIQMLQANFQNQMQSLQQQNEVTLRNVQEISAAREKILAEALTSARSEKKAGFKETIKEMAEFKQALAVFSGDTQRGGGILDTVKEIAGAPGVSDAIRAFVAPRMMGAAPPASTPTAVGYVQVSGPRPAARVTGRRAPSPWPETSAQRKPAASPPPAPTSAPSAAAPAPAQAAPTAESLGITFPLEQAAMPDKIQALIIAVDTAIKADWTSGAIWSGIVSRFPSDVRQALIEAKLEGCQSIIEQFAPTSVLNTPAGHQMLQELYGLLTSNGGA